MKTYNALYVVHMSKVCTEGQGQVNLQTQITFLQVTASSNSRLEIVTDEHHAYSIRVLIQFNDNCVALGMRNQPQVVLHAKFIISITIIIIT